MWTFKKNCLVLPDFFLNSYWTKNRQCLLSKDISQWNEQIATWWWWKSIWQKHQQSCDSVTLSLPKCPHLYTKKKGDLNNYHLTTHHVPKDVKLSTIFMVCLEELPYFCFFQQHKRRIVEHDKSWDQIEWKAQRNSRIGGARKEQLLYRM